MLDLFNTEQKRQSRCFHEAQILVMETTDKYIPCQVVINGRKKTDWGKKEKKSEGRHYFIDWEGDREVLSQVTFEQRLE